MLKNSLETYHVTIGFHRNSDASPCVYASVNILPLTHTHTLTYNKPSQEKIKDNFQVKLSTVSFHLKDHFKLVRQDNFWSQKRDRLLLKTEVTIIVQKYSGRKCMPSVFTYKWALCLHQQQYNCRCSIEGRWLGHLSFSLERMYET